MCCDYYVQKSLVIEFISIHKQICTIKIDAERRSGFINKKYKFEKYEKKLKNKLAKKSYIKMMYEKKCWIKDKYQRRYELSLKRKFPQIKEFIKVYKNSNAFPLNNFM
jgi:hypothetical protein